MTFTVEPRALGVSAGGSTFYFTVLDSRLPEILTVRAFCLNSTRSTTPEKFSATASVDAMTDPAELAHQLSVDQVAFADLPDDPALQDQLVEALDEGTGIVIAPPSGETSAGLRDLAQDVLDASGLDTVIVRSPDAVAAVSHVHSRSSLESAQEHLVAQPDYVVGVREFLGEVETFDMPWLTLAAVAALALLTVVAWAAVSVRSTGLTQ